MDRATTATMTQAATLSRRIAQSARQMVAEQLPQDAVEKVKISFLDMLSCAIEARELPWGRQAIEIASRSSSGNASGGKATVIGAPHRVSTSDAAFANATLAHGLVREDMHTGSVSHLGVVIFPTLLALAQRKAVTGKAFILGAICGYEVGASVGRALVDQDFVRLYRPTGTTGPIGAAVAGSILLGLDENATVSAVGLAANTTGGLNEWPYSGGDEMFFHPGFAARNAVTAVELAELGAVASETALEGRSGLFAALGRSERVSKVTPFSGAALEIMSVYHKPAPACNYAQTACQAALALATEDRVASRDIAGIQIKCSAAAVAYPGCNFAGPFDRILQAKMSILYCVAATLAQGRIDEANYHLLSDPEVMRLVAATALEEDSNFTADYPGAQGAEVSVILRNGQARRRRMRDLVPASASDIRARFRSASEKVYGAQTTDAIEATVDSLEKQNDVGMLGAQLSLS
jgi:2-methylcitrate dehydratase PrpD